MNSKEIRSTFLNFFEQKQHKVVPSAPIVVKNDPTLMFINAGMNQFKDLFLGNKAIQDARVADTQKCLRVSGKHNDLEEVGVDTYHHTLFEMLGNWSFGDYFKKEAIHWAWELLVDMYKIDKNRLYFTVFEGDKQDGTALDQEAYDLWKALIEKHGLDADHLLTCGKKDNFWEMGEMGPCGPCSEIHIDLRDDAEIKQTPGKELVNKDHPQVVEIWNLVFMEFNRLSDRSLQPLPKKHVDTGMGFERLAMVLQHKKSNYDTDVFKPLINKIVELSNTNYTQSDSKKDVAIRVIADHIRAIAFTIADGQLPSNTGAGYVIRRILRRAIRYGYSFLKLEEPFLHELVEVLVKQLGDVFPELVAQQSIIKKVIREEEESFLRTLIKGIDRFNNYVDTNTNHHMDGKFAFELYDTYGFPIDLTELLAHEKGFEVDMAEFSSELQQQKERSRSASKIEAEDWIILKEDDVEEFVGYDRLETTVSITRYRKVSVKEKENYQLVFNITPFYPEGGGQVGDSGYIEASGEKTSILNTKKENNLIIHYTKELPKDLNATYKAVVNKHKRWLTACNHTATHLLHEALREVLGEHVEQKGSLVNADHLRFDFSHFQKVSEDELLQIERLINLRVRSNFMLEEKRNIPMQEAEEMGAVMLFGEKYGDLVRVIQFGNSKELCGGTHVKATGEIGYFKIRHESSIAAGIRRIEAITAEKSEAFIQQQIDTIHQLNELLKHPKDTIKTVENVLLQNNMLMKEVEQLYKEKSASIKRQLLTQVEVIDDVNVIAQKIDLNDSAFVKDLAFQLKGQMDNLFLVLGTEIKGKPNLTVVISENLVKEKSLNAGNIIREAAKEIKGGGGGQPFYATAGGTNKEGLDAAIAKAKSMLN